MNRRRSDYDLDDDSYARDQFAPTNGYIEIGAVVILILLPWLIGIGQLLFWAGKGVCSLVC